MKNLWVSIILTYTGCMPPVPLKDVEKLKSGEVTQLAFTNDGQSIVVVNQFRHFGNLPREKCHSRLRNISLADWKVAADTSELALVDLVLAPCAGETWMIQANDFDRYGKGNPINGPVFYKLSPLKLERQPVDIIQQGRDNIAFAPCAIACAAVSPLCVVYFIQALSPIPMPPWPQSVFVFNLKSEKKTVDLNDFPSWKAKPGDFVVSGLEFSPNGKQIASSISNQLQLHDADTGKLLKSMQINSAVGTLHFSPSGKLLAALCQDGTLLIFHSNLSEQIFSTQVQGFRFEKYGSFPRGLAFVGDGHLAVLTGPAKVELFDTKEWKSIHTFEGKKNRVNCVAGSPDGKLLAIGFGQTDSLPGLVQIWDADTGKLVKEFN